MQRVGLQYDAVLLAANHNPSDLWNFFVPSTDGITLAIPEHRVRFSWLQRGAVLLAANDHDGFAANDHACHLWDLCMPCADDVALAALGCRLWACRLQPGAVLRATNNHCFSSHLQVLRMPSSAAPATMATEHPLW